MNRYRIGFILDDIIEFNARDIKRALEIVEKKGYDTREIELIEKIDIMEG